MYVSRNSTRTFRSNVFKIKYLLSSKLSCFYSIQGVNYYINENSNNEKTFVCVSFHNADEKFCEYENFFVKKSKNWDKLIQSGIPGQHTKNRDCPGKTGTIGMFEVLTRSHAFL